MVPSFPVGGKGRPGDWLQILWDDLCWLCRKLIPFILPQIIGLCMPVVNSISAFLAPADWFKPDAPDIMAPPAENPADYFNAPTKIWICIRILSCIGTLPSTASTACSSPSPDQPLAHESPFGYWGCYTCLPWCAPRIKRRSPRSRPASRWHGASTRT